MEKLSNSAYTVALIDDVYRQVGETAHDDAMAVGMAIVVEVCLRSGKPLAYLDASTKAIKDVVFGQLVVERLTTILGGQVEERVSIGVHKPLVDLPCCPAHSVAVGNGHLNECCAGCPGKDA